MRSIYSPSGCGVDGGLCGKGRSQGWSVRAFCGYFPPGFRPKGGPFASHFQGPPQLLPTDFFAHVTFTRTNKFTRQNVKRSRNQKCRGESLVVARRRSSHPHPHRPPQYPRRDPLARTHPPVTAARHQEHRTPKDYK